MKRTAIAISVLSLVLIPRLARADEEIAPQDDPKPQEEKTEHEEKPQQEAPSLRNFAITVERSLSAPTEVGSAQATVPLPGVGVTWRLSDSVGLQTIVAFGYSRANETTPVTATAYQTALSGAARLLIWPLRSGKFRLGTFAGAGYRVIFESQGAGAATGSQTRQGFGVEFGVRPEYQFSSRISMHTTFGGAMNATYLESGATTLALGFSGDIVSHAGISLWF
jgi:hypothetical protein